MQEHHSPSPAPQKTQALDKGSEKHSIAKEDKTGKSKKTKSTPRMHSFDRDFKDGKYYKNPDVTRKTPSYMRQTCASLTKVKTFRNNGTSPGPERREKSSLNPLAESDEHDSEFQTDSDEDQFGEDDYDSNEENEDDEGEGEGSFQEEIDTEVNEKEANLKEANSSSSPLPTVHEDSHTGEDAKLSEVVQDVGTECLVTVAPNQQDTKKDNSIDDHSKTIQETTEITNLQDAEVLNTTANTEEKEAKVETQRNVSLNSIQKPPSIGEEVQENVESPLDHFSASEPREIGAKDLRLASQPTQGQRKDTQSTFGAHADNPVQQMDPVQCPSTKTVTGDHSGLHQRPGKSKSEGRDRDEGSSSSGVEADKSKTVVEKKEICTFISNSTLRTICAGAVAGFFGAALLFVGIGLTSKQND